MNYRKGSKQTEQHHHGKGVNANILLHKALNTSQNIYPMNAHCSTSHINYLIDSASENGTGCFLDSKDTKCVVCGNISPVLKPGKRWVNFETPDHSLSRMNAFDPSLHGYTKRSLMLICKSQELIALLISLDLEKL